MDEREPGGPGPEDIEAFKESQAINEVNAESLALEEERAKLTIPIIPNPKTFFKFHMEICANHSKISKIFFERSREV